MEASFYTQLYSLVSGEKLKVLVIYTTQNRLAFRKIASSQKVPVKGTLLNAQNVLEGPTAISYQDKSDHRNCGLSQNRQSSFLDG